jgi:RHS repeat-associated protein
LPGRNGLDLNLTLYYNSRVWTIDGVNGTATFNADKDFPSYGFRLGFGYIEGTYTDAGGIAGYILTEPDGTKRELRFNSTTGLYESFDSSYVDFNATTLVLRRKDGTQWVYELSPNTTTIYRLIKIKDTNGNFISITYNALKFTPNYHAIGTITDTLGRVVTFNYDANSLLTSITQGAKTWATFSWNTGYVFKFNFSSSLLVVDSPANNSTQKVLTGCTYPNGTGYVFTYGDWGIVNQITRTSGTGLTRSSVSYDYPSATSFILSDSPVYTTETVFDGVNTGNWTHTVAKTGGQVSSFAITAPVSGTVTTTNLYTSGWQTGLVSSVTLQQGATTFRTSTNTWTQDNPSGSSVANPRLSGVTTALNDASPIQQSKAEFDYTTNGNVSELREFDWGLLLKRKTQTDYLTSYTGQHILDRPSQVRVLDGGGTLVARTDFAYDGGSLSSVSGAAQHDDAGYGSTFSTRGNLTSTTRYPNLPSTFGSIARSFTYDTLGNLLTAQVDCCSLEQWSFSATTQYAYPDTIKRGPTGTQLTTSRAYDFNTGLPLSETDPNNQIVNFGFDPMNRIISITRPLGANTTSGYDDNAALAVVTTTNVIDASTSLLQVTTLDGAGRPARQETRSLGGTTYSIVETQYDALGRVTQVSNPHGPSETAVWTTYPSYDGLSRPTVITPPGSAGSYQYSYAGNATTVTDPAGKQRETFSDALGRLVRVYEPGYDDGAPGTGTVTISGVEQSITTDPCADRPIDPSGPPPSCPTTVYDSGSVWITVNGFTAAVGYGLGSTASSVASALAGVFNSDASSPVTATASGATITLRATMMGPQTNYTMSTGSATNDPADFGGPSFTGSPSGPSLTGGVDGAGANGHPPSINTPLVTVYTYDPLDGLTVVKQGVQSRTFSYDSLGRVLNGTTPEAGTVSYSYTDFSAVATRLDARNVVTSYTYDGLNRLKTVSYSGTPPAAPAVNFNYDAGGAAAFALGRLTSMTDGVGSETYIYDPLGRVTQLSKVISGVTYPIRYGYNLASELLSITYPSGRVVAQSYDPIGRLGQITSQGTNYLSNVVYNAAHEPTSVNYGNGVQATVGYNPRLQLQSLAYAQGAQQLLNLTYGYGTGNNGQIQSITDGVDSGRTVNYTYDAWARLKTAQTTGSANYPTWGLSWDYDRYGNRKAQNVTAGSGPPNQVTPSATTNRLTDTGYSYDAAGNMTADGVNTLTYDGENRVVTNTQAGAVTNYTYDGKSLRVQKQVGTGTPTIYLFWGTKVIAEYAAGAAVGSPTREYIYSGSQLLAMIQGTTTTYHHPDHLSARVSTDPNGNVVRTFGHYPFGEIWYETGTASKWKFTTYERDAESANDYAMFRTYVNRLGRFDSPDPAPLDSAVLENPQKLNRYSYVLNNPVNLFDPFGLDCLYLNDAGDGIETIDDQSSFEECSFNGGFWGDGTVIGAWIDPNSNNVLLLTRGWDSNGNVIFGWTQTGAFDPGGATWRFNTQWGYPVNGQIPLTPYAAGVLGQVYQNSSAVTNPVNILLWYAASGAVAGVVLFGPAAGFAALDWFYANPYLVYNTLDFVRGVIGPGFTPVTPWGVLGASTRLAYNGIRNRH